MRRALESDRPRIVAALWVLLLVCGSSALRAGPTGWVINEVLADPDGASGDSNRNGFVNTSEDEFIEIVNLTGEDQDLSGWMISDFVGVRHVFPPASIVAADCAVVVFGGGPIGIPFTGTLYQVSSTGMLGFNNGGDTISLLTPENVAVAVFEYGAEGGMNQSMVRDPDITGDVFVLHSSASTAGGSAFSAGTFSDGASFEGCPDEPPPPEDTGWVINEILADPDPESGDANGDGEVSTSADEFVEIYNSSDADVEISRWTLSDRTSVRHVFNPGTIVPASCSIVVFGGGIVGLEFNGSATQVASSGALGLNNDGDTLTFSNSDGIPQAVVSYGAEGGMNQSLVRVPDVTGEILVLHASAAGAGGAPFSPGVRVEGVRFDGCPDEPVEPPSTEIWEIQGSGSQSPIDGEVLLTANNIVTAVISNGFFIQTPEERSDQNEETSDGIFVFTSSAPRVSVGDVVDVAGQVDEFFDLTEIVSPTVTVKARGAELPEPVFLDETVPSPTPPVPPNDLERFEGMRVRVENGVVTGPYNQFGELLVVARPERAFREPGAAFPGEPGLPVFDGNPEIFEIDPAIGGLPDALLPAGTEIESCEGPLSWRFGAWQIVPTELVHGPVPTSRPVPAVRAGELSIGTQNLLGLVDTSDDPGLDEEVIDGFELARRLAKHARAIREVLRAPDVLAVQEVENVDVLEALALEIRTQDATLDYQAFLERGPDIGGRNIGFLVRDTFEVDSVEPIGGDARFELDGAKVTFSRPPLVLRGAYTAGGADFPVTVICVHLRSLIEVETSEFTRRKRLAQAEFLAGAVQAMQDASERVVIAGDFNAFEFTDAYVDVMGIITGRAEPGSALLESSVIVDPPLENLTLTLPAAERYSTINLGSAQAVDHIVVTADLLGAVAGFAFGRGNADFPVGAAGDTGTPLRASDHDGAVARFTTREVEGVRFVRGDFDANGTLLLNDAVSILNFLFLGATPPGCEESADANADGRIDLSDGVGILGFLFLGLPAPAAPFPDCGVDPDPGLSCNSFPRCA